MIFLPVIIQVLEIIHPHFCNPNVVFVYFPCTDVVRWPTKKTLNLIFENSHNIWITFFVRYDLMSTNWWEIPSEHMANVWTWRYFDPSSTHPSLKTQFYILTSPDFHSWKSKYCNEGWRLILVLCHEWIKGNPNSMFSYLHRRNQGFQTTFCRLRRDRRPWSVSRVVPKHLVSLLHSQLKPRAIQIPCSSWSSQTDLLEQICSKM